MPDLQLPSSIANPFISNDALFALELDTKQRFDSINSQTPKGYPIPKYETPQRDIINNQLPEGMSVGDALFSADERISSLANKYMQRSLSALPTAKGVGVPEQFEYDESLDKYIKGKFGYNPYLSPQENEEMYYKDYLDQSLLVRVPKNIGVGAARFLTGVGAKTVQTFGYLGAMLWNGVEELGEAAGMGENDFMTDVADNTLSRWAEKNWEQEWKNSPLLSVYKPSNWEEKGFFSKLKNAAFWTDEVADGAAFMGEMILSTYLTGGLGRMAGLGKIGAMEINMANKMGKFGKVADTVTKFATGADDVAGIGRWAFLTTSESAFEAAGKYKSIKEELIRDRKLGKNQYTDFEIQQKAGEAGSAVFKGNMLILSASNAFENRLIFNKLFNKNYKNTNIETRNIDVRTRPDATPLDVAEGKLKERKYSTKLGEKLDYKNPLSATRYYGSKALKGYAVEGLWEENAQLAVERLASYEQFNKGSFTDKVGMFSSKLYNQTVFAAMGSDTEAATSIGLGALIAGPTAIVSSKLTKGYNFETKKPVTSFRERGERRQIQRNTEAVLADYNKARREYLSYNDIYEKNDDGTIKFENNKPVINEVKLGALIDSFTEVTRRQEIMDEIRNPVLKDIYSAGAQASFIVAAKAAGIFDRSVDNVRSLSKMSESQLNDLGLTVSGTSKTPDEVADSLSNLGKIYDQIKGSDEDMSVNKYRAFISTSIALASDNGSKEYERLYLNRPVDNDIDKDPLMRSSDIIQYNAAALQLAALIQYQKFENKNKNDVFDKFFTQRIQSLQRELQNLTDLSVEGKVEAGELKYSSAGLLYSPRENSSITPSEADEIILNDNYLNKFIELKNSAEKHSYIANELLNDDTFASRYEQYLATLSQKDTKADEKEEAPKEETPKEEVKETPKQEVKKEEPPVTPTQQPEAKKQKDVDDLEEYRNRVALLLLNLTGKVYTLKTSAEVKELTQLLADESILSKLSDEDVNNIEKFMELYTANLKSSIVNKQSTLPIVTQQPTEDKVDTTYSYYDKNGIIRRVKVEKQGSMFSVIVETKQGDVFYKNDMYSASVETEEEAKLYIKDLANILGTPISAPTIKSDPKVEQTEDQQAIEKAIPSMQGMFKSVAQAALATPETADSFIKDIADQALNKIGSTSLPEVGDKRDEDILALERAIETFTKDLVDYAIAKYPKVEEEEEEDDDSILAQRIKDRLEEINQTGELDKWNPNLLSALLSEPIANLNMLAMGINNIKQDGTFNEERDIRNTPMISSIPPSLKELANEIFPEYQKTARDYVKNNVTPPPAPPAPPTPPITVSEPPPATPPSVPPTTPTEEEWDMNEENKNLLLEAIRLYDESIQKNTTYNDVARNNGYLIGNNSIDQAVNKARKEGEIVLDTLNTKELENAKTLTTVKSKRALTRHNFTERIAKGILQQNNFKLKLERYEKFVDKEDDIRFTIQKNNKTEKQLWHVAVVTDLDGNVQLFDVDGNPSNTGLPVVYPITFSMYTPQNLKKMREQVFGVAIDPDTLQKQDYSPNEAFYDGDKLLNAAKFVEDLITIGKPIYASILYSTQGLLVRENVTNDLAYVPNTEPSYTLEEAINDKHTFVEKGQIATGNDFINGEYVREGSLYIQMRGDLSSTTNDYMQTIMFSEAKISDLVDDKGEKLFDKLAPVLDKALKGELEKDLGGYNRRILEYILPVYQFKILEINGKLLLIHTKTLKERMKKDSFSSADLLNTTTVSQIGEMNFNINKISYDSGVLDLGPIFLADRKNYVKFVHKNLRTSAYPVQIAEDREGYARINKRIVMKIDQSFEEIKTLTDRQLPTQPAPSYDVADSVLDDFLTEDEVDLDKERDDLTKTEC